MGNTRKDIMEQPFFGDDTVLLFKDNNEKVNVPTAEVAWSEDAIFQRGNITKYNPDDLIGKKGFGIYRKMMLDEQVKAVTKFKRDAITSRPFFFEVPKDALSDEEAERRIKICNEIIAQMLGSPIDAWNGIMTAMWQGVSYTEKNFMQIQVDSKTYWGLKTLKLKPFDTFEALTDDYGNVLKWVQKINGREQEIKIEKFVHHVQGPEFDAQYGQSELREAYRAFFSKDMAITFLNMFMERAASGYKWINTKSSANTPGYNALKAVLSNTVNGAGMLFGPGDEFHVEFPAGNGDVFHNTIDKHDLAIARALLVPNLLGISPVASKGGSRALGETQLEAFLWTLDQDAGRLEEALNEQLFKQLGAVNFGDENWPRIKFGDLSEQRKIKIIGLWKDMVTAGAVKHSDSDEKHIRDQLEFPEKDEESVDDEGSTDDNLNGGSGTGNPGDKVPAGSRSSDGKRKKKEPGKKEEIEVPDETLKGIAAKLYKAKFTKAMQRVDFKVIQRASETLEEKSAEPITSLMYRMTQDTVSQTEVAMASGNDEALATVKFDRKDKAKMQKLINASLQGFWKIGQRHAENEIDKAKGLSFSVQADRARIDFISQDFFKAKSFRVAGKLTDDAIAIISQVISNGVKGGKTFATIEQDIYRAMGAKGFLAMEDYKEALGAAIDPELKNPQARIDTMLRTNGFEAVNEARYSYFTDPQLDGFVEALEYSAIMDNRTTQVCQHLDGHTHEVGSEVWETDRPPNHFNCRSLLMAVTEIDSWTESDEPTIAPQEGFQ